MPSRFPIGAWIKDDQQAALTGGIVSGRFLPYRGQVVSWGHLARHQAYRIRFGVTENMILASQATCATCGTPDESDHAEGCYEAYTRHLNSLATPTPEQICVNLEGRSDLW